jgi:hypothetical protein
MQRFRLSRPRRRVAMAACASLAALAIAPAVASAAVVALDLLPDGGLEEVEGGTPLGREADIGGVLTSDGTAPLAKQEVVLEGRPHPYRGSFETLGRDRTGPLGRFDFAPRLDRNYQVRVRYPVDGATSKTVRSHTAPAANLSGRIARPGDLRLTVTYRVPRDVRWSAVTSFYAGSARAKRGRLVETARTRRVRAGRYTATANVNLPAAWNGRYQAAFCYRVPSGSPLGDSGIRCPRRSRDFDEE